jgi:opacity protein-like surface antigen
MPANYGTTTVMGGPSTSTSFTSDSSATGSHLQFAYQTILGVSYKITDYFKLSLDYRYLKAMPTTFTVLDASTPTTMRGSYSNHRLMMGVTAFLD